MAYPRSKCSTIDARMQHFHFNVGRKFASCSSQHFWAGPIDFRVSWDILPLRVYNCAGDVIMTCIICILQQKSIHHPNTKKSYTNEGANCLKHERNWACLFTNSSACIYNSIVNNHIRKKIVFWIQWSQPSMRIQEMKLKSGLSWFVFEIQPSAYDMHISRKRHFAHRTSF